MLTFTQALFLGFLQGVTELFPISSLGHTVIIPSLIGWNVDQADPLFLEFIVATHLATALVLLAFYFRDWVRIVGGILKSIAKPALVKSNPHARLGWLLIAGTIPAGVIGLLFKDRLEELFAAPTMAAAFLFLNGILLLAAEYLRRRAQTSAHDDARLARLTFPQAMRIGLMQCLALLPGFSRTGATLTGGLWEGLDHTDAARFSFLLATPIIFAAAVLKLPELLHAASADVLIILVGAIAAAVAAYASVKFLTRYFRTNTLTPFAVYCLIAGALAFFII